MACRLGLGSMTYTVMAQNTLGAAGIHSRIVRLDVRETKHGCAYGLETECNSIKKAMRVLKNAGIHFSELL